VWSDTFSGLEGTDVASQVLDYLTDSGGTADPNALHILEGGANDFPRVANPAVIVQNLVTSFLTLQQHGARHVVIVLLPDLGKTPRLIIAEQMGQVPPGTAATVSAACAQLNQALKTNVNALTASAVTVTYADMYQFVDVVAAHPKLFGFVNVQMPYLLYGNGTDPNTWLFWDDVHPTTRGHQLFADDVALSLVLSYLPRKGHGHGPGLLECLNGLVGHGKG
jgi:outer membrane lipase/esterase